MDARAAENRKALNSFIDPKPEDKFGYDFLGLSGEEAESVIENDPAEDEWEDPWFKEHE
jgi:hypothetical protein